MRGGVTVEQGGGLLFRARSPQGIQQPGDVTRVVEGGVRGVRGGPVCRARVRFGGMQQVPVPDKFLCFFGVSLCDGVLAEAGCVAEQAIWGGASERIRGPSSRGSRELLYCPMAGLRPPHAPDKPVQVFCGEELPRLEGPYVLFRCLGLWATGLGTGPGGRARGG